MPLLDLPDEILVHICSWLHDRDLCELAQINHRFHSLSHENALWRTKYERKWLATKQNALQERRLPMRLLHPSASHPTRSTPLSASGHPAYDWRLLYINRRLTQKRWREQLPLKRFILEGHSDAIHTIGVLPALENRSELMVTASSDGCQLWEVKNGHHKASLYIDGALLVMKLHLTTGLLILAGGDQVVLFDTRHPPFREIFRHQFTEATVVEASNVIQTIEGELIFAVLTSDGVVTLFHFPRKAMLDGDEEEGTTTSDFVSIQPVGMHQMEDAERSDERQWGFLSFIERKGHGFQLVSCYGMSVCTWHLEPFSKTVTPLHVIVLNTSDLNTADWLDAEKGLLVLGSLYVDVIIIDVNAGSVIGTLAGTAGATLKAYRGFIFTGVRSGKISVWRENKNDGSWVCVQTLAEHSGMVTCFAAHGNKLASGSRDNSVKLWKLAAAKSQSKEEKDKQREGQEEDDGTECCCSLSYAFSDHMNTVSCLYMDENLLITAGADWAVIASDFAEWPLIRAQEK